MCQQVHDQGENAEAQGELECEDRAAGRDGDQPASPGPGPPDVLEAAEAAASATLRDTAEAVICTGGLLGRGEHDDYQYCMPYIVLRTT